MSEAAKPKVKAPKRERVNVPIWTWEIADKGPVWHQAAIISRGEKRVTIDYNGEKYQADRRTLSIEWPLSKPTPLDRPHFVYERTPEAKAEAQKSWRIQQLGKQLSKALWGSESGAISPAERALLGLPERFTTEAVHRAYRSRSMRIHPDQGGDAELFHALVYARDAALLAADDAA
jgi:hypothetical protein